MKRYLLMLCTLCLIQLCMQIPASCAGDWRFPVGPAYLSGYRNLLDIYKDNLRKEKYDVDVLLVPLGVLFHPYYQFENGMRIDAGFGPALYIAGDAKHFEFPLHITGGYTFLPSYDWSPYIRIGAIYHVAAGDYVKGSDIGPFGAIGAEIRRLNRLGFGCEIAYDASKVKIEEYDHYGIARVKTIEWMISVFIVF